MRRLSTLVVAAALLGALARPAAAAPSCCETYDDSESHPLRVAAYILNPVGYALEWLIFRPLHCLVSNTESAQELFGYERERRTYR